jgi:hypothetical protein
MRGILPIVGWLPNTQASGKRIITIEARGAGAAPDVFQEAGTLK